MNKLCLLFVFAVLSHEALGFRIKRQSEDKAEDLEDRYGWNRPGRFPNPGQLPWQGRFPSQGGWQYPDPQYPGNFPWQFPGQNQDLFPGQRFPGQQFPGQQFPGQQFPGQPFPGQQFPGQQFPGQQLPGPNPGQGQNPGQPTPNQTTTPTPNGDSTTQSAVLQDCLRSCPVTSEYNPVCGTDNVTYDNPGRLLCAQSCGVTVTQVRASRCPNATIPPPA